MGSMKTQLKSFLFIFTVFFSVFLSLSVPVKKAHAIENSSISISHSIIELEGEQKTKPISIRNEAGINQTIEVEIKQALVSDQKDGTVIIKDINRNSDYNNIYQDIEILLDGEQVKEFSLSSNEEKKLSVEYNTESKTIKKDYYFLILFTTKNHQNISISSSSSEIGVGVLLLLSPESSSLSIELDILDLGFINFITPSKLKLLALNKAAKYEKISTTLSIKNLSGKVVNAIQFPSQFVFANSEKYLISQNQDSSSSISIQGKLFGLYRVEVEMITSRGTIVKKDQLFLVVPFLWSIIISAGVLVFLRLYLRVKKTSRK